MRKLFLVVAMVAVLLAAMTANAEDCIVIQPDGNQVTVNCQSVTASIQDVLSLQAQIDELRAIIALGGSGYAGGLPVLPPNNQLPDLGPAQDRLPDFGKK